MNLDNALDLMSVDEVTGLFIGRAAWEVDGLVAILDAVAGSRRPG